MSRGLHRVIPLFRIEVFQRSEEAPCICDHKIAFCKCVALPQGVDVRLYSLGDSARSSCMAIAAQERHRSVGQASSPQEAVSTRKRATGAIAVPVHNHRDVQAT